MQARKCVSGLAGPYVICMYRQPRSKDTDTKTINNSKFLAMRRIGRCNAVVAEHLFEDAMIALACILALAILGWAKACRRPFFSTVCPRSVSKLFARACIVARTAPERPSGKRHSALACPRDLCVNNIESFDRDR